MQEYRTDTFNSPDYIFHKLMIIINEVDSQDEKVLVIHLTVYKMKCMHTSVNVPITC